MFGFYDPASLSFQDNGAVIDFVNAQDGSDVTRVEITSQEHASRVSRALETQKTRGITTLEGELVDFRGSIAFNPKVPDEALLTPDDEEHFGQAIPVKLAFSLGKASLPRYGFAMGQAAPKDGALVVYKLAMRGFSTSFDRAPAPGAVNQVN